MKHEYKTVETRTKAGHAHVTFDDLAGAVALLVAMILLALLPLII
jgi:hypothetical protein